MKVLIISRGYPTGKYPLNGIFEFDQAKALANLGHKVIFASVDMRSIRRIRKWGIEKIKKEGRYMVLTFQLEGTKKYFILLYSLWIKKTIYNHRRRTR